MIEKCPGQDKRYIQAESLKCKNCGYEIEIFSDEVKVRCAKCKTLAVREVMPSCIDWCKYAKECVGQEVFDNYAKTKSIIIKDKLIKELEEYFGPDLKRINHAKQVMDYADELLRLEGGDWHIVIPASILHDVGIKAAEEKHGSSAGHFQELEGPEIARKIFLKLGFKINDINEICEIIGHHHSPGKINTGNFKIIYDSDWLVNLKDETDLNDKEKVKEIINKVFFSQSAKEIARKKYL